MVAGDGEVFLFHNSSAEHLIPALEEMPSMNTYYIYTGPSGVKCFISPPTEILMPL